MNTLKFNQIKFNHIGEQPTSSIKLQEKSVTIKENGTTEVMPDSGYALSRVKVNVDVFVPEIRYYKYDTSKLNEATQQFIKKNATTFKYTAGDAITRISTEYPTSTEFDSDKVYFELNYDTKTGDSFESVLSLRVIASLYNPTLGYLDGINSLEEITSEEYYKV